MLEMIYNIVIVCEDLKVFFCGVKNLYVVLGMVSILFIRVWWFVFRNFLGWFGFLMYILRECEMYYIYSYRYVLDWIGIYNN